ncbi:hypothetical protein ULMA_25320 [Patiriisocius marinus]|uniref:Uncharacterized protein n=1 Tax=Patiriisocius marinus TaxID=1397112 RepID=A0A5J4IZD0_9FLAO|nr:hypothetical protein ULMA_25320 [Patiriisocius marinus]
MNTVHNTEISGTPKSENTNTATPPLIATSSMKIEGRKEETRYIPKMAANPSISSTWTSKNRNNSKNIKLNTKYLINEKTRVLILILAEIFL